MTYSVGRGGRVLVNIPYSSLSVSVTITAASGRSITVYSDVARSSSVSMPDAITANKTYYLDRDDVYTVSAKVNGTEASVGGPLSFYLKDDTTATVSVDRELSELAGAGSALTVQEEGVSLATVASTLNFVGDGVTASGTGATKTITVSGASSALPATSITTAPYSVPTDGRLVLDGAITSGSANLACATSTPFTNTATDAGKPIIVTGAGASGADLVTTISTVTDTGHAVLATTAGTTVSAQPVHFGSDCTAGLQRVLDAMATSARFYAPAGIFMVAGGLQHAASVGAALSFKYNSVLRFPAIDNLTADKPVGELWGATPQHHIPGDAGIKTDGTIFVFTLSGASYDATYGEPSCFGGPDALNTAGGGTFTGYSNFMFYGRNFRVRQVRNGSAWDLNLKGLESCDIDGVAGDSTEKDYLATTVAQPTRPTCGGLAMPAPVGSNTPSRVGAYTVYGKYKGYSPADHSIAEYIVSIYNVVSMAPQANNYHASKTYYLCAERCAYKIAYVNPSTGVADFPALTAGGYTYAHDVDCLDIEYQSGNPTWQQTVTDIKDGNNVLQGKVRVTGQNNTARLGPDNRLIVTGALNLDIEYQIDGAWQNATLLNSWVALDAATYDVPGYRRTRNGYIELRGVMKSGTTTAGTTLFTLPDGYRPPKQMLINTSSAGVGLSSIEIVNVDSTHTNVFIDAATANNYLSLEGIRFKVASH